MVEPHTGECGAVACHCHITKRRTVVVYEIHRKLYDRLVQKYTIRTACAIPLYGSVYDIAEPVGYAGSAIFGLRNHLLVEQL